MIGVVTPHQPVGQEPFHREEATILGYVLARKAESQFRINLYLVIYRKM